MHYTDCKQCGRTYIIAEMSGNHGGQLEKALEIVQAAAEAGADCLKTQTYTADTLTLNCNRDEFVVKGGLWNGEKLYDLYSEGYTPWEWMPIIKKKCDDLGLDFMSSPFDRSAVDYLEQMGCQYYKIASPELVDIPLIEYVAKTGKTMFISTGMAIKSEIEDAIATAGAEKVKDVVLLKCCSQYPTDYNNMNLLAIKSLQEYFSCTIGLSDHSFGYLGAVIAVTLGAKVIEKHICMSRQDDVVDSKFSMEPDEFKEMVSKVHDAEKALGNGKIEPSQGERRGIKNRRSLYIVKDIKAGDVLTGENIRSVRPGLGILPKYYKELLGKRILCDAVFGTPLSWDMVER